MRLVSAIKGMDRFVDIAMAGIGEAYLNTKQEIIVRQQEAIREISTPGAPSSQPNVDLADYRFGRFTPCQTTYRRLTSCDPRTTEPGLVVMDITGVPIVDSKVANHFMQTVDAARLMGATGDCHRGFHRKSPKPW